MRCPPCDHGPPAVDGLTGNGLKGVWSDASCASGMRAVGGGTARFLSRRAFGLVALWLLSLGLRERCRVFLQVIEEHAHVRHVPAQDLVDEAELLHRR